VADRNGSVPITLSDFWPGYQGHGISSQVKYLKTVRLWTKLL